MIRKTLHAWRAIRPTIRVGIVMSLMGFLLGFLLAYLLLVGWGGQGDLIQLTVVPAKDGGTIHPAIDGRTVIVKAVLQPQPGRFLKYTWDFGDESEPTEGFVTTPYAVWAQHDYPESEVGARFTATLRLIDAETGEVALGAYEIEFVEPNVENKIAVALDDALWALHVSMTREEDPVHGEIGYWNASYYPVGSTAMAVLAFEVNGFDSRAERRDSPYTDTVDRALNYLLSKCESVEIVEKPTDDPDPDPDLEHNPDSDGDGIGITVPSDRPLYELPLVTMALVASQDEHRVAHCGFENVHGRTFREITVDMLDYLAFAQNTAGNDAGGWRYTPNYGSSDLSVTQWPVLAMMSAEEVWGIETPAWVKNELKEHFLTYDQNEEGGFGYTGPGNGVSVRLTAAGLIGLNFVDAKPSGKPVTSARQYLAANWETGNIGDFYAMYAVVKAAKLADPEIKKFGDHDWRTEYAEHLFATQQSDGTWSADGQHARGAMATAWPALIISKDIFATGRPVSIFWAVVCAVSGLMMFLVLLALLIVVLLLRRRRGPAEPVAHRP